VHELPSILALDLGTRTGWALQHDGREESGVQAFDLQRGESPGMRFVRFNAWLREITEPLTWAAGDGRVVLIGYEAPHHRGGAATEVANGFSTRVQEHAARFELNHVAVHSATLKKWVTGTGRAQKHVMIEAVRRRGWIPMGPHDDQLTDDEADAIGLLHYLEQVVLGKATAWMRRPRA
jgi:crossover junction endodeoxyribonuclease RuvC